MITHFHPETPEAVKAALLKAYRSPVGGRVRLVLGDVKTGKPWNEEHDIMGYICASMGPQKVPLLRYSRRSFGGPAILDHCILAIICIKTGRWTYKADNFTPSDIKASGLTVTIDGEQFANCSTIAEAQTLASFMRLERHKK